MKTILLTGLPRSGTTLCCHILNEVKSVLALHEPLTPQDFAGFSKAEILQAIKEFASATREEVSRNGRALSRQKDGRVPDNPLEAHRATGELRQMQVDLGWVGAEHLRHNHDFHLVIKQNAFFSALIAELQTDFPVYAVIRNPLSVLASWQSVDLPVNKGRLPAAEMLRPELTAALNDIDDRLDRQIYILNWLFVQYQQLPSASILRYETFVGEPATLAGAMQIQQDYSGEIKARTSKNTAYNTEEMQRITERLLTSDGAIWDFYTRESVINLLPEAN